MKKTKAVILVVLVIVLVGVVTACVALLSPKEQENAVSPPMLDVSFNEIVGVSVTTSEDGTLTFLRDSENYWALQEFPEYDFDQNKIAAIASFFSYLQPKSYVPDGASPENFGFSNPQVTVIAQMQSGAEYTLYVGAQTMDRTGIYLKLDGDDRIGIFDDYAVSTLNITKELLVNARPPMVDWDSLEKITVHIPGADSVDIECYPAESGGDLPVLYVSDWGAYLESAVYYRIIKEFGSFAFDSYLEETENLSPYGLDIPNRRYEFQDSNGTVVSINVGRTTEDGKNYYVSHSNNPQRVFLLSCEKLTLMSLTVLDLVDQHLFPRAAQSMEELSMPPEASKTVNSVTVTAKGKTTKLINHSGEYSLNDREIPEEAGRALIEALTACRFNGFMEVEIEASDPTVVIQLDGQGYSVTECAFYPYKNGYYAVSQNGNAPAFFVDAALIDSMAEGLA